MQFETGVVFAEIFDAAHFCKHYQSASAAGKLRFFIDEMWESNPYYAGEFSEIWMPFAGYSYLINLGLPIEIGMQDKSYQVRHSAFIPGTHPILLKSKNHHHFFLIRFNVSPVLFQKDVDFSEYEHFIYPLIYLIESHVIDDLKLAGSFSERVEIVENHYERSIHDERKKELEMVAAVLFRWKHLHSFDDALHISHEFNLPVDDIRKYFLRATGTSYKRCFQISRIRSAIQKALENDTSVNVKDFGYHHTAHFHKHLHAFAKKHQLWPIVERSGIMNIR